MFRFVPFLLTLLCPVVLHAADNTEQDKQVQLRIAAIKAESAKLPGHPWAGEYYAGDGLGVNLRLFVAPKNGVAYQWHGCLGLYEQNIGTIKADGPRLKLKWKFAIRSPLFTSKIYLPIRWGERAYLVPPHEIIEFCEEGKSKWGSLAFFPVRQGQRNAKPVGKPDLPKGYERYWTLGHIKARSVAVLPSKSVPAQPPQGMEQFKWRTYSQTVTLDVGSRHGVLPGMVFHSTDTDPQHRVTVKSVRPRRSDAVTTIVVLDSEQPGKRKPPTRLLNRKASTVEARS